jgi:transcriptional regulator with XRE-family HTH domain
MPFKAGVPEPARTMAELMALDISRDRASLAAGVGMRRWDLPTPITRGQLATKAKINPRQIARLEAGDLDPQFSTLMKIADALEVSSLDELLGALPLEERRPPHTQ